ncbi:MAG TPA: glycoside hydrolase family 3 C-terminal domain-containing protein, partial [Acidimicrobiales bacterium]|nr:glycoside hydrolase family 3 C-terminal domain-containing protein [Acidimicrobiales bacterium]
MAIGIPEREARRVEHEPRALEMSPAPPTEKENRAFGPAGVTVGYLAPEARDLLGRAERLASESDAVVVVVGTNEDWESEGFDRESMSLPGAQDELIARVAGAHPEVVVVVNAGSPVAMPWAAEVGAILQLWFPGQEAGNALADVLFGDVNPSARLPVTVPESLADSGAAAGYPAVHGRLAYGEGVNVGYRHFDATGIEPRFCFGHGLSYTSFSYGPV